MQFRQNGWIRTTVTFAMLLGGAMVLQTSQPIAFAQTAVTGSINGVVTDSTGAVVPNAAVTVKDTATGAIVNLTSNKDGRFTVPFLKPDVFDISATAPGLQSTTTSVQVLVGQQSAVTVQVTPSASSQTVQVSANNTQLIDTQTANTTTTFTTRQFEDLPMPGGDITTIAYTVPGVLVNPGSGYGNFTSNGLPGLSNLVILNGADDNDPFLHVNNTGSSNMTIGQDEIAQASIVQNGYSVQYGRQAGAIETYATKSGTNRVHGLLNFQYNSDGLNANDFFNNLFGQPRSKAVSRQYAAQIGGPIWHDKLFFFADTEGIRYILPTSAYLNFPSAAFQKTVLNTIPATSVPLYGQMFKTFTGAPAYAAALPVTSTGSGLAAGNSPGGCGAYAGTPVFGQPGAVFGDAVPCVNASYGAAGNLNKEYTIVGRVDWVISDKHDLFVRILSDHGQQPTTTSLMSPLLNTGSSQPSYSGQLNDTYVFNPNLTNQFVLGGLWYTAIFGPSSTSATLAFSPTEFVETSEGGTSNFTGLGQDYFGGYAGVIGADWGTPYAFPGGRNVTQYQAVDGLSWVKANHNFRFGFDFERDDVTDSGNEGNTFGGFFNFSTIATLAGGTLNGTKGSSFNQNFAKIPVAYSALYNVGIYAQDEWRVKPNLVVDYGVRFDRTGNPLCNNNCYSHYMGGFPDPNASLTEPYNATIAVNQPHAFESIEKGIIQPRVGFNWDMKGDGKTVLRGGVGLFADSFPGVILTNEYGTFPAVFGASVQTGTVATAGVAGSAPAFALASANALNTGFDQGLNFTQVSANVAAEGASFSPPNYYTSTKKFLGAKYLEYSLQLQRQLTSSDAVILSYAGNHGYDLLIPNNHLNQSYGGSAYDANGLTFGGLPAASPDPRFAAVTIADNAAISNYNGISVQYKHIDRHGVTANVGYTYSHALDDISNGGAGQPLNFTNSVTTQISPQSASKLMYSNSDSDVRHSLVLDVTYVEPNHFANKLVDLAAGGWTIAAKAFWRSGTPFSVFNVNAENDLYNATGGTTVLADVLNNNFSHVCKSFSKPCFQTPGIFNGSGVTTQVGNALPQTNFGNVPRNAFYGPHYADVDLSVYKALLHLRTMQFQVGAQAYNVLNHPNFAAPNNNASQPTALGQITGDLGPPTSPYGSYQGSLVSGRVMVVTGRFTF